VETTIPFTASFTLNRQPYQRRQRQYDAAKQTVLGISIGTVSNEGNLVAFTALGDLWLNDLASGEVKQLTDDPFADQEPVFSPDGQKIIYQTDKSGRLQLWLYDLNSAESQLVAGGLSLSGVSWSPDSQRIAGFKAIPNIPLNSQLTIVNLADGSEQKVFRPMPSQPTSWSPDGQSIATAVLKTYSSRYREGVYQLLLVDIASNTPTLISPTQHKDIFDARLAADGKTFTYVQGALLWRARLDGEGEPEQITNTLSDNVSWSGNGDYAVFLSGNKMHRLTAATGELKDITPQLAYTQATPSDAWVLRVGKLFDGKTDSYQENVDITIANNRIQSIGPQVTDTTARVVDMSDKAVFPGLFEMHAHMALTSESQGRTWLAYGVTSVRDPGSNPYVAKERQEIWDSGRSIGPRTHITGFLTDGNRVYYSVSEGMVSIEHLDRAIERTRLLQLDFIKTYVRLPDEWQKRVVDAAHAMGIPTSSHELFPAVSHGMDHVEHIGGTSRRGYQPKVSQTGHVYGDVIELLAKSQMGITPTAVLPGFAVIAKEDADYFTTPQFIKLYGERVAQGLKMFAARSVTAPMVAAANGKALRKLVDAGALVVSGTDAPFVPYGAGLHAELRLYVRAGLTPFETLRTATSSAATAAGVINELGTLEPGKLADIVVVDGDPLADITDADNVVMTVKNGIAYSLETLLTKPD
ncbi:MAG: amidohydrolase family protein, partial [Pseudomonadota bacterium]